MPVERLEVIREKVSDYDWSGLLDAGAWESGGGKDDLNHLADYWLERFDWRRSNAG